MGYTSTTKTNRPGEAQCSSRASCWGYGRRLARHADLDRGQTGAVSGHGRWTPGDSRRVGGAHGHGRAIPREWLNANAAGNYVQYHAESGSYSLSPEQAFVLALDNTPVHLPGMYHMIASAMKDEAKLTAIFRTGKGFGWHEHEKGLFEGCERFFRPGYLANLTTNWIPALDGVDAKLRAGGKVADVGCGHGASTILMALAYPKSRFFGFDYHAPSIEQAKQKADAAGVSDRVTFEVAPGQVLSWERLPFGGVLRLPA